MSATRFLVPVALVAPSDPAAGNLMTGRAVYDYAFDVGSADSREFLVHTVVGGNYARDDRAADQVMVTVARPPPKIAFCVEPS